MPSGELEYSTPLTASGVDWLTQVRSSGLSIGNWLPGSGARQATFIDFTLSSVTFTPGSKRDPALSPLYSRQLPVSAALAAMHAAAVAVSSAVVLIDIVLLLVVGRRVAPVPCLHIFGRHAADRSGRQFAG